MESEFRLPRAFNIVAEWHYTHPQHASSPSSALCSSGYWFSRLPSNSRKMQPSELLGMFANGEFDMQCIATAPPPVRPVNKLSIQAAPTFFTRPGFPVMTTNACGYDARSQFSHVHQWRVLPLMQQVASPRASTMVHAHVPHKQVDDQLAV